MTINLQPSTVPKGYDWTIEYDNGLKSFDPKELSLHLEPEQETGEIKGTILAERLKEKSLNSAALDYLLEHPELIPEAWKIQTVFFWGTIYCRSQKSLYVRYLCWGGGQWHWSYLWLVDDWDSDIPAAVLRKSLDLESSDISSIDSRLSKLEQDVDKIRKVLRLD